MVTKSNSASLSAVKGEALDQSVTFEFDGESYTVAPAASWDLEWVESLEDGKIIAAIRSVLGAAQWTRFKAKKRTAADVGSLFEALQAALGLGN